MQVRQMKEDEHDFFLEMLYESIYITEDKPSKEVLLSSDEMRKYHEDWGRPGDEVLVAEENGELTGAIWYRQFTKEHPGYGFAGSDVPEIGMAVRADKRGKGVGRKLLEEVVSHAMNQGYDSLSLSVDPYNHQAVKLYKDFGFEKVGTSGTSITMQVFLTEADQRIRNLQRSGATARATMQIDQQSRRNQLIIGGVALLSGILLLIGSWIASAIYAASLDAWNTRSGKFFTAMQETSIFPLILSAVLLVSGITLIIREFNYSLKKEGVSND
ncbi:GNAT family N-acetyltransferase [Jeotgalibacillus haloalkalitolerans]|uniref:GNAT family N-acetyltransferase n=1 Tax=Jeotgalibacillus haloalkalitolerans TaxID=3104292 RepID=A0ABU5KQG1_9BACL|nr:GNAT family N-acetyltransferase [Jeotgalibacillus sp. HH7-29]MDZ5713323.1 GNAT family N-acetyltransferase [Jeotgalibacillus sp. HH7-29]